MNLSKCTSASYTTWECRRCDGGQSVGGLWQLGCHPSSRFARCGTYAMSTFFRARVAAGGGAQAVRRRAGRGEYRESTGLHSCISCKVYCSVRRAVKLRTADTRDTDSRSLPHYTTPPGAVHRLGVPSEGQGNGKAEATTRAELASTCERGVSTTSLAVRDTISRGGTPSS